MHADDSPDSEHILLGYRCEDCHCAFRYDLTADETYRWIIEVGRYEIVVDKRQPLFSVIHFSDSGLKLVLKAKVIPDSLTSSNALQKLKTYILFS